MSSWCETYINFHGNKKDIKTFYDMLMDWTNKSVVETDFGSYSLANIMIQAGFRDNIIIESGDKPENPIACRGYIEDIEDMNFEDFDDTSEDVDFYLVTDTASEPMVQMWREIIKKYNLESIDFGFVAENSDEDLYLVLDTFNEFDCDIYVVSAYDYDKLPDGWKVINDLGACTSDCFAKFARLALGTDETDVDKLIEMVNKISEDADVAEESYPYVCRYKSIDSWNI